MNRLLSPSGDVLPASEGTLVYFASYLARTVPHGTIKLYLAAVRNLHITAGYSDPLGQATIAMIWAAFTLAFFGFLRCREFTYSGVGKYRPNFDLSTNCITFHPNLACPQFMTVQVKSSKTDVFRQGHSLAIARTGSTICAVTAMREYFLLGRPPPGPLLLFQSVTISPEGSFRTFFEIVPGLRVSPLRASRATAFAYGQPQLRLLLVCQIGLLKY